MKEAEDIVQDIFVKIIEKENSNQIKDLSSYIKTAIKNASLKRISYNRKFQSINEEILIHKNLNIEEESDITLEKKIQLYKQINSLPKQCKKIFLLCVLEDLKYKEVADILDISVNTVKTQIKKAYKTLRTSSNSI